MVDLSIVMLVYQRVHPLRIHPLSVPWPPRAQVQPSSICYMDNNLRSLRAHFLAPVHTTVPVDFLHTDIVSNFFSGFCQVGTVGRSLAHSLLHRILLSLLAQVQPSTSLTWTPSGERFGITFLLLLAFPADSFYNSLALSNSAPFFGLRGKSSTFSSTSQYPFFYWKELSSSF